MNLINIPAGSSSSVVHFCGKSLEGDFQKWLFQEVNGWNIPSDVPAYLDFVCFASSGAVDRSPLIAQCKRLGIPVTVLGSEMTDDEWSKNLHFNKLFLLKKYLDSGNAKKYILALDSSDVLICGSIAKMVDRYLSDYDGQIVFGAECHYMYKMAMWNGYAIGDGISADAEAKEIKIASENKSTNFCGLKYLNAGMMIGPREGIYAAVEDAIGIAKKVPDGIYKCDQSIYYWLWHNRPEHRINLDFGLKLFCNVNHALPWDFCIDEGGDGERAAQMRAKSGKADAVYLFCGADTRDISLSIRLLRKHAKNLGEIWVIGGEPTGVDGINHIPFHEPNCKNKEANMTRKCLLAAHLSKITDPFALFSDDQFILAPMDLAALPLRYKGDLERGRIETTYGQRTRETYLECLRLGLPTRNYNTHWPVPIRKRPYIEALGLVPWDTEAGDGILCRSVYGNLVGGGEFCVDSKESARDAIAALSKPCLSMPNSGGEALYSVIEAAAR